MSGNNSDRPPPFNNPYRNAEDIIRSILDDNASSTEISPSGELYRAIERFHAHNPPRPSLPHPNRSTPAHRDLARDHLSRLASRLAPSWPLRSNMSSDSNPENQQRRFSREPEPSPFFSPPPGLPPPSANNLPPLRSITSRRHSAIPASSSSSTGVASRPSRLRASDHWLERHRNTQDDRDDVASEAVELQEHQRHMEQVRDRRRSALAHSQNERDLNSVDSELRALWDFTNTPANLHSELSFPSPPLQTHDSNEDGPRSKRRKLDSDRLSSGFTGFRYGRYGQVEPGQLSMEIVSCDGGIYADDGHKHAAENILKNDSSVYCTSGPRCNIVLRHRGATVFNLKELVIKAPRSNYTSPVQEGMVFVSMTSDHLLTRTAQYQITYEPPPSSSRRAHRDAQPTGPILSIRHNEDGSTMTRAQVRARRLYNIGLEDEDNDLRVAQIPSEFNVQASQCPVTIEYGDDDADETAGRRAANEWTSSMGRSMFGNDGYDSETSDEGDFLHNSSRSSGRRPGRFHEHISSVASARAEAADAAQQATQEAVRAVGGELLAPDARFFIERDKSTCTMRFDPPVSGRFILLKMWSPHRDPSANIDIQAVAATGFAGPRYFPAVDMR